MKNNEITELLKSGTRRKTSNLVIYQIEKTTGEMAAIVSTKQGKAVKRNRFKRRVRNIHRKINSLDSVYILKKGHEIPGYKILKKEIESLDE